MSAPKKLKSVFVLSTGGTIGMQRTSQGYAPVPDYLATAMAAMPELQNSDIPRYTIYEYDKPIDSSNMTPQHWLQIGEKIIEHYDEFDGFVVLHGTDTMAYTGSALSFMFENLSKPIILTSSQLPLFDTRSDARVNLINALMFASDPRIAEVCVYFNNRLFRGNRCKKMDATSFSAFASPNFPVLGKVGTDVLVRRHLMRKPVAGSRVKLQSIATMPVGILRIFPGIAQQVLKHFMQPPMQALILETYGLGTAPSDPYFLDCIRDAVKAGMIIVNCSQCPTAKVKMSHYAAGTALLEAGVVSGGDMTTEATLAKLFYLFSKNTPLVDIKHQLTLDLRGELTI